jgi:nitroimidazol reductase NimA-like FMN-containing flavoprotein (pyridoxamine 5'-phosphate oxidase superfamily)
VERLVNLADVIAESARYGRTAWIATATTDGQPHAVPVAMSWIDDELVAFVLSTGKKIGNLRTNPQAMVHFQVSAETDWDSLMIRGTTSIIDTVEGRRALWDRMGYDLAPFEPGGPESDNHVFVKVTPKSATVLRFYGIKGRDTWRAS